MYFGLDTKPKEGTLVICRCPNWCASGYQIAKYQNGEFCFDEQPNDWFNQDVIAWTPLNEDGEQLESNHKSKANKWDELGDKIAKCYPDYDDDGNELDTECPEADLGTIGQLAASAYGWL